MYPRHCKNCGKALDRWARSNQETCGQNCRKAWSRRKDTIKRTSSKIMSELQTLRLMLKQHPDLADQINADLRWIQGEIADLRRLRPDDDTKAFMEMMYDHSIRRHKV
jgi:predicted nucleic acid-binding Zn ribbon protein